MCICYTFDSIDICFLFFPLFFSSGNFLTWTMSAQIVGVEALRPGIGLPSRGAGPRIRIVFINEDRLCKRGPMRPQKQGSSAKKQMFHIFDRHIGDAKNGFRDDFLDAFYIDFVQRPSHYEQ